MTSTTLVPFLIRFPCAHADPFLAGPIPFRASSVWSISPACRIFPDATPATTLQMQANNKVYSFTIALYEYERTIQTLWSTVREFAKLHPEYIAPNNALNFLVDDVKDGLDGRYNLCQ